MLGNRKLILDTFCEVYEQLRPWADDIFFNFIDHEVIEDAIYVIGRAQGMANVDKILDIVKTKKALVVYSNPAEGSQTIKHQIERAGFDQYIRSGEMLLIGGGDMEPEFKYLCYDSFLPKLYDYDENIEATTHINDIYARTDKPYKFLFLNGRGRPNRKFLLESFRISGLLDQSLWTNLDRWAGRGSEISLWHDGEDLMTRAIEPKLLDEKYEVPQYRKNLNFESDAKYVKFDLFKNLNSKVQFDWGEIYLIPEPYIDTYFSLVTETIFLYPYSFRTEKIWKPIAMAHPWIAVSNAGFYRDIQNLGFKTFGHLIDETFDQIDNNLDRICRIRDVVEDLCASKQRLNDFLQAARPVCEYNQQHLWTMREQVRKEFPDRFKNFLITNGFIDE